MAPNDEAMCYRAGCLVGSVLGAALGCALLNAFCFLREALDQFLLHAQ